MTVEEAQHEFISRLVDSVKLASVRSQNFPVSVMIAQACIESGFQGARLAPAQRALSRVVVHNTLFGITKPDTPAWSWFSECKTISSPTVAVAGGPAELLLQMEQPQPSANGSDRSHPQAIRVTVLVGFDLNFY